MKRYRLAALLGLACLPPPILHAEPAARVGAERIGHRVIDEREEQRVPIGRRLRCLARGDDTVGARPVLDDHRLAESLREFGRDLARADVGRAAGDRGHEDLDRPAGEALRASDAARQ